MASQLPHARVCYDLCCHLGWCCCITCWSCRVIHRNSLTLAELRGIDSRHIVLCLSPRWLLLLLLWVHWWLVSLDCLDCHLRELHHGTAILRHAPVLTVTLLITRGSHCLRDFASRHLRLWHRLHVWYCGVRVAK